MKPSIGFLTAWVWLGSVTALLPAGGLASGDTLWVFKHDGTVHCGPPEGIAPNVTAQELTVSGIIVLTMQRGRDGREGVALCGPPTGHWRGRPLSTAGEGQIHNICRVNSKRRPPDGAIRYGRPGGMTRT